MPDEAAHRESPLCGETMHLRVTQNVMHVRGERTTTIKPGREWVCPECDHFEEAEEEGT